jgi:hypothetical protein
MTLETIAPLSDDPALNFPQSLAAQSGPAGECCELC